MMCTSKPPVDRSLPPTAQVNLLTELVFDELTLFKSVCDQYRHLGMHLEGAIAICPSNPGFQLAANAPVLMPETSSSPVVITFDRPVQRISAIVNGARPVRITGFDRHSNILAHDRTNAQMRQTAASSIASFPWHKLAIEADSIARLVFASDAPFLIQSLSYR